MIDYLTGRDEIIQSMPDWELRDEAKRRGYKLIKIPERIKLLPCTCGYKHSSLWSGPAGRFYKCDDCGIKAPPAKTQKQAKLNWNKMIESRCD